MQVYLPFPFGATEYGKLSTGFYKLDPGSKSRVETT